MNEYIHKDKITTQNCVNPETEERFPEFYQKIRASDAWLKHSLYLVKEMNIERLFSKNDKALAWNAWVDAKKCLVKELNEKYSALCDGIVGQIIRNDLKHLAGKE